MIGPSEKSSLRAVVIAHIEKDFPVPAVPIYDRLTTVVSLYMKLTTLQMPQLIKIPENDNNNNNNNDIIHKKMMKIVCA